MSIDLATPLSRPVTLAAVLDSAGTTLTELLGLTSVPELIVADSGSRQENLSVADRRLGPAELASTIIGQPIEPESSISPDSVHYDIGIAGHDDQLRLMVIHHLGEEAGGWINAVVSPCRSCVGIAVATGLTLAIAVLGGGEFVDEQMGMLGHREHDPRDFITATRLPPAGDTFDAACERYLRQFPLLGDWPDRLSALR